MEWTGRERVARVKERLARGQEIGGEEVIRKRKKA